MREATGTFGRAVGAISGTARLVAGVVLVGMVAFILVEIVLRVTRGAGTNVLVEFVGYGLAAMTFLAASAAMREGGMVRVGLLLSRVRPGVRRVLDTFCIACGIAMIGLVTVFVARDLLQALERGYETDSLFALPAWLPPLPMFLGLAAFLLDLLLHLVLVASGRTALADDSPDVI